MRKYNRNNMKKKIRLTESDLHRIVNRSGKQILREGDAQDYEEAMLKSELAEYNRQIVGERFEEHIANSLGIAFDCIQRLAHKYYYNRNVGRLAREISEDIYEAIHSITYDDNGKDFDDPEYEEWENGGVFTVKSARGLLHAKYCLEEMKKVLYKQDKSIASSSTNLLIDMAYKQILRAEKYIDKEKYETARQSY